MSHAVISDSNQNNAVLNFAIISCGGTLAMEPNTEGLLEPVKSIGDILKAVNIKELEGRMRISPEHTIELFKLDSTNLTPEHWKVLNDTIDSLQKVVDGITIL